MNFAGKTARIRPGLSERNDSWKNTSCGLIAEGRVRGSYATTPEVRLQRLLRVIVRNLAANAKGFLRNRIRIIVDDMSIAEFVPDAHSPTDVQLEVRETIVAIRAGDTRCVRMLLRVAMGDDPADIAREFGRRVNTIHSAVQRGRNKVLKKHRNGRR